MPSPFLWSMKRTWCPRGAASLEELDDCSKCTSASVVFLSTSAQKWSSVMKASVQKHLSITKGAKEEPWNMSNFLEELGALYLIETRKERRTVEENSKTGTLVHKKFSESVKKRRNSKCLIYMLWVRRLGQRSSRSCKMILI